MTGSNRKLLFFIAKLYAWLGEVGNEERKKKGSLYSSICHHFLTKPLINISLHFGSIMQASKACERSVFLTYMNPYTYKQDKLPVKAVTSLSEVAECFPCRNWMYCSLPSVYLRLEISHRVQTTANTRLNISS